MTPEQEDLLTQARESVAAAKLLKDQGYSAFAAARAYYAMFYVAEAFLLGKGLAFSSHGGVHSAFAQHFIKTGLVPQELHRFLSRGMELRHIADYGRGKRGDFRASGRTDRPCRAVPRSR